MGKYDTTVAQIKDMISHQEYVEAMEEIEDLSFKQIPSISDMYLFADIFSKAEKLDVAKDLYYTAYRRTGSKPALYKLLMLVIRMGDLSEAKELFRTFELKDGGTLDTYEFRYRIAKACGEPRSNLIAILEELKENEFTEEWGMQLAILYEMEGMRDECIRTCEDIEIWFGSGNIVSKATALKEKCMSPDWVKPEKMEIPEPEEPELDYMSPEFAYAPIRTTEIGSYDEDRPSPAAQSAVVSDDMSDAANDSSADKDIEEGSKSGADVDVKGTAEVAGAAVGAAGGAAVKETAKAANGVKIGNSIVDDISEGVNAAIDSQEGVFATDDSKFERKGNVEDIDEYEDEYEDEEAYEDEEYVKPQKKEKKGFFSKLSGLFKIDFDDYEDNPENEYDDYADEYEDEEDEEEESQESTIEADKAEKESSKADVEADVNDAESEEEAASAAEEVATTAEDAPEADKAEAADTNVPDSEAANTGDADTEESKVETKAESEAKPETAQTEVDYKPDLADSIDAIMKKEQESKATQPERKHNTQPEIESLEDQLNEVNESKKTLSLDDTLSLEISKLKKASENPNNIEKLEPASVDSFGGGKSYISIKTAINNLHEEKGVVNFAITGAAGGMTLAVAKKLFKELKKINYSSAANLGKISARKLDEIKIGEWSEKFIGGCMYISDAGELSEESIKNIVKLILEHQKDIVIILEGDIDKLNALFEKHPDFGKVITYKIMIGM